MSIQNCSIIELPQIYDPRGNLSFIEGTRHIPFEIKRVFYLYDVPVGKARGGHAHKNSQQFIIAMSGSLDIILDDGFEKRTIHLTGSHKGVYVPPMIWPELEDFSAGAVCMVLASDYYNEADYYRDYREFLAAVERDQ